MQSFRNVDVAQSRILIVDDQDANIRLLEFFLDGAGFHNYTHTTDSRGVLELLASFRPDLLLLDLPMPGDEGIAVLAQLKSVLPADDYLPVLVLTADRTSEAKQRVLSSGADDYLSKPLDPTEALLRINILLRSRWLYAELRTQNESLEQRVRERTTELAGAQLEVLERLAKAAEYRDDATGQHTQRVGKLSALIGRAIGLAEEQVGILRIAATLHDIGKIGIPDRVLLKQGILTPEEFTIIKSHTNIGGEILRQSKSPILQMAREIALSHHERWDGTGYPQGLKGDLIPLSGRVVAIADAFDALTHDRPYKKKLSLENSILEMKRYSERQFDPRLLKVFLSMVKAQGLEKLTKHLENFDNSLTGAARVASDGGRGDRIPSVALQ